MAGGARSERPPGNLDRRWLKQPLTIQLVALIIGSVRSIQ
jgi:hypothetical protein